MGKKHFSTHGIPSHERTWVVRPPHNITVTMTISDVVVRMAFRAVLLVLRMASAKAIAPLRPTLVVIRKENNKKLGKFVYINDADIFFFLSGLSLTL